ncbi:cytochrome P450 [Actinoplanes derwentensis]|uniref:Cytochrome P450 n=1 Tax=Actinoplanes derwentensis TaxID=113562 RepID=A0A1H2BQ86_9ACTN|nr:cytochrome P450 [Actinoplanes derwentensis]GID86944.1 cytochrome P450 [Actinoplanes derwentensis]SDT60368.1 Cytochrome P450 [Actinoplanes derwentensis]
MNVWGGDHGTAQGRARRRDRQVYLRSHPVLFLLLAAVRSRPVVRLGRTVMAHSPEAFVDGLTRVPLDRTADGTTGGAAGRLTSGDLLFDQEGAGHRGSRREVAESLGADGVTRLRPIWREVLNRRLAPLAEGRPIDLVDVAAELSGATAAALLKLNVAPLELAAAAREAAATGAREHVPGLTLPRHRRAAQQAADRLNTLVTPAGDGDSAAPGGAGLAAMMAVAAINTTVAGLPRAVAWCADADLWGYAETTPDALTAELLRVTAPTPLLPRVAAAAGTIAGLPVRAGDRLILIARHAVGAHQRDPTPDDPAPQRVSQLVFGLGSHACPGARLARMQFTDTLTALAPYRPVVLSARADRRSALPGWSSLILAPGDRRTAR